MIKEFPYHSSFAELQIKPVVSADKDRYLALASLIDIKHFIPNVDTKVNIDVLPIACNACVINRVNKNRDVIDTKTALAVYKQFINKPINVEHNRQKVIGTILTAGFSEFGTDRPLTEEQVQGMTAPFNITLGGIIWRVVCPELSDHIEDSSDPTSENYLSVSASWELGFTGYRVALLEAGEKNLAQAKQVISDKDEVDKIKDKLTSLGGDGKVDDLFAFRMPTEDVLPLGIGLTEKPAAEVKGVAVRSQEEVGIDNNEAFDKGAKKTPQPNDIKVNNPGENQEVGIKIQPAFDHKTIKESHGDTGDNKKIISHLDKTNVKIGEIKHMKFTSIKDITDDNLKQCSAASVAEFISDELKKASEDWVEEKSRLTTQLSQAQEDGKKLKEEQTQLADKLKEVQATIDSLNAEKVAREKVEKFNERMSVISEQYALDDEVRAAIVEDVKALASDDDFAKWQKKVSVLLKGYAKKKEETSDKPGDKKDKKCEADDDMEAKKKAKASEEASATLNKAVDNGETEKGGLPNGSQPAPQSLIEKYKNAFAKENFEIRV